MSEHYIIHSLSVNYVMAHFGIVHVMFSANLELTHAILLNLMVSMHLAQLFISAK